MTGLGFVNAGGNLLSGMADKYYHQMHGRSWQFRTAGAERMVANGLDGVTLYRLLQASPPQVAPRYHGRPIRSSRWPWRCTELRHSWAEAHTPRDCAGADAQTRRL
jgi:hypothetical protein